MPHNRLGAAPACAGRFTLVVLLLAGVTPSSSSTQSPGEELKSAKQNETTPQPSQLVGKVWVSADPSAAPGTFRIFLPDGTLVMDSCWETYRLAQWRTLDERRIEWTEDAARIEAQVVVAGDRLTMELSLRGERRQQTYRLAQVPSVCPDMPRSSRSPSADKPSARGTSPFVPPSRQTAYRCGNEVFRLVSDEQRATVTLTDGSVVTLARLKAATGTKARRTYTNGRLTFVQEIEDAVTSRVLFARGRMAPVPCTGGE
jgi:membrane-bound inhibitor of C-type lysozyme